MKHLGLIAALLALAGGYAVAKKPKKEDITQVLELPKDPPAAVTAETRRLIFFTSPLSGKGLLSAQVREALRALLKNSGGASIVKIRAFVAGSGDLRRVQAIVSETFTEKKLAIPALSVIQVGILPMEGAQVVLEATAMAKREGNPLGVIWISGQPESLDQPLQLGHGRVT